MQTSEPIDALTESYRPILYGNYDLVDRIVLNGYIKIMHGAGGFRLWWQNMYGHHKNLDDNHLMRFAGRFSRRVYGWAKKEGIPVIATKKGERKHLIAQKYIPSDPDFEGVFLVICSQLPAIVWSVKRLPGGDFHLKRKTPLPFVKHYFFHIMDKRWGHVTIVISGHPPFKTMIMLNGHEFTATMARKRGLDFQKAGNCFTEISEPQQFAEVSETLNTDDAIGELRHLCDKWCHFCLSFGLSFEDQKRTRICYDYSTYQVEFSRNLLFQDGRQMERVFDGIIDRNRCRLDIRTITKIFGRKKRRFRNFSVKKSSKSISREEMLLEKPEYDLTVFKIHFGRLTLKLYTKGEHALRAEVIAHNVRDLGVRRSLEYFPEIVKRLQGILIRFLTSLHDVDIGWVDASDYSRYSAPGHLGNSRVGGIDLRAARSRNVIMALLRLSVKPDGFRTGDLASEVNRLHRGSIPYTTRQASYDLRKFRAKGVVEKTHSSSRCYRMGRSGLQELSALVVLENEIIRPLLSRQGRLISGPPRANEHELNKLYKEAQRGVQKLLFHFRVTPPLGIEKTRNL